MDIFIELPRDIQRYIITYIPPHPLAIILKRGSSLAVREWNSGLVSKWKKDKFYEDLYIIRGFCGNFAKFHMFSEVINDISNNIPIYRKWELYQRLMSNYYVEDFISNDNLHRDSEWVCYRQFIWDRRREEDADKKKQKHHYWHGLNL